MLFLLVLCHYAASVEEHIPEYFYRTMKYICARLQPVTWLRDRPHAFAASVQWNITVEVSFHMVLNSHFDKLFVFFLEPAHIIWTITPQYTACAVSIWRAHASIYGPLIRRFKNKQPSWEPELAGMLFLLFCFLRPCEEISKCVSE